MSISFASAPGNLYNALGKLGLLLKEVKTYQTAQLANLTNTVTGAIAQFDGESDIEALIGSSYIGLLAGPENVAGLAQSVAVAYMNRIVFRDQPQLFQNLQFVNFQASILEVFRQMKIAGASVLAMTVTGVPQVVTGQPGPNFIGNGDGVVAISVKRPLDGLSLENVFAEDIQFVCTQDSYLGSATAGNESLSVSGTGSESDMFAFDWPLGSNASIGISAIDGSQNVTAGNLLTNSGFDAFTSNSPDNWTLVVGTAGTDIFEETSIVVETGKALRILGDGSTLVQIEQKFDDGTGTTGTIDPLTQTCFNIFLRRDGVAPAAGTLTIDWVDENDIVVLDAAGVANTFNVDLTLLTTQYATYNSAFRSPLIMPAELYMRIRLTVALTSGRSVYLDRGALGLMSQMYASGPFVAVFSGGDPFVQGDYAYATITNSRGAAGTLSTFQTLFAQLFPNEILNGELMIPSSSSPTISDTLIG